MDEYQQVLLLKKLLRKEVSLFCRLGHSRWKKSISDTIEEIRDHRWDAVFFGGTLRSLLTSRLETNSPGKPRDVDIVMNGASLECLRKTFEKYISRETRFGGLQLQRIDWQFDVWPLKETFALKDNPVITPSFEDLPKTTFFNVEAIAVEVWPKRGCKRKIFSSDDQFFRGVINRVIEVNREQNPFPELCVIRAIVMATRLQWRIGPRLLRYLAKHGDSISAQDFEDIQRKHYGGVQWRGSLLKKVMQEVHLALEQQHIGPLDLKLPGQMTFWSEDDEYSQRIWLRTLNAASVS